MKGVELDDKRHWRMGLEVEKATSDVKKSRGRWQASKLSQMPTLII